jgi:hypothetical protein
MSQPNAELPLQVYEVSVTRKSYADRTIRVLAHSEEEAERLARKHAGDFNFREYESEYEIDDVKVGGTHTPEVGPEGPIG